MFVAIFRMDSQELKKRGRVSIGTLMMEPFRSTVAWTLAHGGNGYREDLSGVPRDLVGLCNRARVVFRYRGIDVGGFGNEFGLVRTAIGGNGWEGLRRAKTTVAFFFCFPREERRGKLVVPSCGNGTR